MEQEIKKVSIDEICDLISRWEEENEKVSFAGGFVFCKPNGELDNIETYTACGKKNFKETMEFVINALIMEEKKTKTYAYKENK